MEKAKLRPHHIFCERFSKVQPSDRGVEFEQVEQRIKNLTQTDDQALVEVIEGIDELCRVCPECRDDRCQSREGNEEAVRKWDGIILKGLGVSYGETRTSGQWRMLTEEKAPLKFCHTRCRWKSICGVFHLG
jgi:hypothetical protein